jgi:hypothetical protein
MFMPPPEAKDAVDQGVFSLPPYALFLSRRCYFLRGISSTVTLAFGKVKECLAVNLSV